MICAADGPHVGTKIEGEIQDDQGNQALWIKKLGWSWPGWSEDSWEGRLGSRHLKGDMKEEVRCKNLELRGWGWAKEISLDH